ncbi:hypothetical protein CT19425_U460022 [Cupriavidus taiwanensis]|uniref:Uncharacterized protein n=1 Tax=Cupriavidus taiwanensis TaxID=164546 RepID=A0A375I636_9BURK|nr:hypothetical protein CT19425_U460022 [Cupriavidus taiwanensis]
MAFTRKHARDPAFLTESHGTDVSPDFHNSVTDIVMAFCNRVEEPPPLDAAYPIDSSTCCSH